MLKTISIYHKQKRFMAIEQAKPTLGKSHMCVFIQPNRTVSILPMLENKTTGIVKEKILKETQKTPFHARTTVTSRQQKKKKKERKTNIPKTGSLLRAAKRTPKTNTKKNIVNFRIQSHKAKQS